MPDVARKEQRVPRDFRWSYSGYAQNFGSVTRLRNPDCAALHPGYGAAFLVLLIINAVGWAGSIKPNVGDCISAAVGLDKASPTYYYYSASKLNPHLTSNHPMHTTPQRHQNRTQPLS